MPRERDEAGNEFGSDVGEYDGRASDFDEGSADIPVWGWVTGATGRRDAARNQENQRRQEQEWLRLLNDYAPSAGDLTVWYQGEEDRDEYGNLIGDPSALQGMGPNGYQQAALQNLHNIVQQGGWTSQDAEAAAQLRRASAMERGQQLRGANEAAMQQMSARGMGGGGAELAARLSGSQAMAQGQAIGDAQSNAQMQMAAMQRQLQAVQGMGTLGGQQQQQELARRGALDAFNQQNMDWRRGRESRNTAWQNKRLESVAGAQQQAYENYERGVAGLTGQYQSGQDNRLRQGERQDENNQGLLAGIGEILDI